MLLLRIASRTLKIQLLLWVVLALGSAWLAAAVMCWKTAMEALFEDASAPRFAYLPLFAFGAIVVPTFLILEFGSRKALMKKWRFPRVSFAEIMLHLSLLVGGLGFILGVLK